MTDESISSFVAEQRKLLALELQADEEQYGDEEEGASHVLGNLEASDVSVGLYGRTVIRFTLWSEKSGNLLPAHRLTVGDEVEIRTKQKPPKGYPAGVVCEASETHIAVALFSKGGDTKATTVLATDDDENDEEGGGFNNPPVTLVPRSSAEVHSKLLQALSNLERHGVNHPVAGPVIHAMFHPLDVPPPRPMSTLDWQPFNTRLDSSQQEAIAFALQSDRPIALIHGPPGTGKTTTVTELIQQAVHVHKLKVLVTAPSNVAVDNVLERLVASPSTGSSAATGKKGRKVSPTLSKLRAVRLGHPARLKSSILNYSLEALVQSADGTEIVADVRQELQSYLRILSNPKSRGTDKRLAYRELKSLRKEIRTREEKVVQELISSAQVVLATTVGAGNRILDHVDYFDLVVIDEAAQALEASCWIPILRGKRVVLAGDHCQLPPTIKSKQKSAQDGLGRTMFERIMQLYGDDKPTNNPKISRMLTVQYRMHEMIANWASEVMYHGQLQTHESVQKRTLLQLEGFHRSVTQDVNDDDDDDVSETPLLLIDTSGCGMHELVNPAGSRYNPGEATLVARHVQTLVKAGLKPEQMCVITPYNGQVEYLRNMILPDFPTLEIRSVDGFQGGEREAVILSLVRSSDRGGKDGIGFLKDDRRQNVAVTRAKRHLAIICDSETVSQSKFIATLIDWVQEHGEQRSAMEYQSSTKVNEDDFKMAEEVLLQIMEPPPASSPKKYQEKKSSTISNTTAPANLGPEARQGLMDKIAIFADKALPGEEMHLSSTLTSFDRRLVHEFAEQIGLGHRSEGVEGKDRRIILQKQEKSPDPIVAAATITNPETAAVHELLPTNDKEEPVDEVAFSTDLPFSVLALDDEDSDSDSSDAKDNAVHKEELAVEQVPPDTNSLLASLAQERAARQNERQQQGVGPTPTGPGKKSGTTTKKPNQGQKLGGTKKVDVTKAVEEKMMDDLDDMAFLDAQIERAQNAHGRKVVGTGKGYRTIVNGILNTTPQPRPSVPTNTRASATLQAKLKEAQNGRKAKINKKKK